MNIEKLKEMRDYLDSQIEKLKETSTVEEKPFPQIGETFYFNDSDGEVRSNTFRTVSSVWQNDLIKAKNFFQTRLEAEMSHQRDLIVRHDGGARNGDEFWTWCFHSKFTRVCPFFKVYSLEPKFKTEEECLGFWNEKITLSNGDVIDRKQVVKYFLYKN